MSRTALSSWGRPRPRATFGSQREPVVRRFGSFRTAATVKTACAALVLAFAGCTSPREYLHNGLKVGPNYEAPPAAVATSWVDSADSRVTLQEPDDAYWWSSFNDPALASLVQAAYRQNLSLKEAAYRVLAARAQYGFAIGNFFPQNQSGVASYTRDAISENVANHQFTPDKFFSVWNGGFNLSWEIDIWGRYRRSITAARDDLEATIEDYDGVLVTLVADVATQYIQMRTYEAEIVILKENVDLLRKILAITKERFEAGATSEVDVEQVKSLLGFVESFIPEAEINRRKAANALCVLLGRPTTDLANEVGPGSIPTVRSDAALGIPADLLRRRPDVRQAERLMAAQSEQIGIATSNLYPHLYINGAIGVASTPLNRLFEPKSLTGGVGPAFQWNIFNYGRLVNQIHQQEAIFEQSVARYRNTVLVAHQEAENGVIEFLRKQEQTAKRLSAVEAARKSVDLALAMYEDGRSDINRVFIMERELVLLQRFYVRSYGDIDVGLIAIYRALGGGWQIRLREPTAESPRPPEVPSQGLPLCLTPTQAAPPPTSPPPPARPIELTPPPAPAPPPAAPSNPAPFRPQPPADAAKPIDPAAANDKPAAIRAAANAAARW